MKLPGADWLRVVANAARAFIAHDVLTLSAALAFYTLLSFAPLMILLLWTTSSFGDAIQQALVGNFATLAGEDARTAAMTVTEAIRTGGPTGAVASAIGVVVVLVGATSVFAQLQSTLDRIWDIEPPKVNAIWGWLRRRIVSMGVLMATGFVMIVSTVASSAIGMMLSHAAGLLEAANEIVTTGIFAGLFAALFRYLPDARLSWRHALGGGSVAAGLFALGKWVIGVYLAHGHVGKAYGAAGSFVVLLVWTYYSSAVFFFAAELLQAWLTQHGIDIEPIRRPGPPAESAHHTAPSAAGRSPAS